MQFLILSSFSGREKIVLWYFCYKIKRACCCIQRLTVESLCNYIRSAFGILCDSVCMNEIRFKLKYFPSSLSVEMTIDMKIPYPNKQHQREIHISIGPCRIPLTSYIYTYNFGIICTSRVAISLAKCSLFMALCTVYTVILFSNFMLPLRGDVDSNVASKFYNTYKTHQVEEHSLGLQYNGWHKSLHPSWIYIHM